MVSNARLDLPEPESPVMTTSFSRGRSSEIFLRLCSRAPRIDMNLLITQTSQRQRPLYQSPKISHGSLLPQPLFTRDFHPVPPMPHQIEAKFRAFRARTM